ncbi:MAG: TonB-dependent receptor, partial [Pseudomonadota bacterium]
GTRVNADWRSRTEVLLDPLSGVPSDEDLFFSDLFTMDVRLFADLGRRRGLVRKYPFLNGVRASFVVSNVFNERQQVVNGAGETPTAFQPDLLDPDGRVIGIEIRKIFL